MSNPSLHEPGDTDSSASAGHHTLGWGPGQAAPGDETKRLLGSGGGGGGGSEEVFYQATPPVAPVGNGIWIDSSPVAAYYWDGNSWEVFPGVPGATGPQGPQGIQGIPGTPGSVWYTSSGVPAVGVGVNGDYALDSVTGNFYKKITNVWTLQGSLKGPQGDQGNNGLQGPIGPKGDQGDQGDQGIQGVKGDQGIKGDQGDPGPQGLQGIQGEQGTQGEKGDKGDKGDTGASGTSTLIVGSFGDVATPAMLPSDGLIPANFDGPGQPVNAVQMEQGYSLVYSPGTKDIWVYVGVALAPTGWLNGGNIQGPPGPEGDPGIQGPVGPIGPEGPPNAGNYDPTLRIWFEDASLIADWQVVSGNATLSWDQVPNYPQTGAIKITKTDNNPVIIEWIKETPLPFSPYFPFQIDTWFSATNDTVKVSPGLAMYANDRVTRADTAGGSSVNLPHYVANQMASDDVSAALQVTGFVSGLAETSTAENLPVAGFYAPFNDAVKSNNLARFYRPTVVITGEAATVVLIGSLTLSRLDSINHFPGEIKAGSVTVDGTVLSNGGIFASLVIPPTEEEILAGDDLDGFVYVSDSDGGFKRVNREEAVNPPQQMIISETEPVPPPGGFPVGQQWLDESLIESGIMVYSFTTGNFSIALPAGTTSVVVTAGPTVDFYVPGPGTIQIFFTALMSLTANRFAKLEWRCSNPGNAAITEISGAVQPHTTTSAHTFVSFPHGFGLVNVNSTPPEGATLRFQYWSNTDTTTTPGTFRYARTTMIYTPYPHATFRSDSWNG